MRFLNIICSMALLFGIYSCGNNAEQQAQKKIDEGQKKQQEELWDQVMAIHDEVMPLMGEVNQYSRNLKSNISDGKIPEEFSEKTDSVLKKLEDAHEKMFDWMANFKQLDSLRDSLSHGEILDYLKKEQVSVTGVKVAILGSIEESKALINILTQKVQEQ